MPDDATMMSGDDAEEYRYTGISVKRHCCLATGMFVHIMIIRKADDLLCTGILAVPIAVGTSTGTLVLVTGTLVR